MEFDKTRVYTAVNAEELKIGSLIIAALNLEKLECQVKSETDIQKLEKIAGIDCGERFGVNIYHDKNNLRYYPLAYLIEPPKEPQYKPFSTLEKAKEIIEKHGGWIRNKEKDEICLVTGVTNSDFGIIVYLAGYYGINSTKLIHERFSFFDDDSPCGELAEEGERNDEKGKD